MLGYAQSASNTGIRSFLFQGTVVFLPAYGPFCFEVRSYFFRGTVLFSSRYGLISSEIQSYFKHFFVIKMMKAVPFETYIINISFKIIGNSLPTPNNIIKRLTTLSNAIKRLTTSYNAIQRLATP